MNTPLKILLLEDNVADAEILQRFLLRENPNIEFRWVTNKAAYTEALDSFYPNVILSDNTLPQFNAGEALQIFKARALPIPFILVTGTVSEEFAAGIIKSGADDYILKSSLVRLPGAIEAALQKKKTEATIMQSEETRKLIMNAALDAIVCIDTNGSIITWNPQAEQLFGWNEPEVLGKKLAKTVLAEQFQDTILTGINHYLKTGEGPVLNKVIELIAVNRKGMRIPVELAMVHIRQNPAGFFCAFIRDISERKKTEAALKFMEQQIHYQKVQEQKKISRAIIKAQEQEKNYIGKELHDNISQILASSKMYLSTAAKKSKTIMQIVKFPMELINNSIEELRSLSHKQVAPVKNINLEEQVLKLLGSFNENDGPLLEFHYSLPEKKLPDDLKLNIYRVVQEQISNIIKHADAQNINITMKESPGGITVIISDNGKGFDVSKQKNGIGISNMINRIESYNGQIGRAHV